MLVASAVEQALEVARTVGMRRTIAALGSSEGVGHWKEARDFQTPTVAKSRPAGSGLRRASPFPSRGCLEMVVDIGVDLEDSQHMADLHMDLDSDPAETVAALEEDSTAGKKVGTQGSWPWSRRKCRRLALTSYLR